MVHSPTNAVLKEWAIVCRALENGSQTLLIRRPPRSGGSWARSERERGAGEIARMRECGNGAGEREKKGGVRREAGT
jgi:hypothetical protein